MALYDYQCKKCKHYFEVYMNYKELDTKKPRCPDCNSSSVRRAYIHPTIIRFKGSGFYSTDNKKTK